MNETIQKLKSLFLLKFKFALTSSVATLVDYFLYLGLVEYFFAPVPSNIMSTSVGMVINFILQKRYIFDLQRKVSTAFLGSVAVSMGGIALSTSIIYGLNQLEFFAQYQALTKLVATGLVFFYNFYL